MIFLADFSVIKPDFGLFFWSCVIFLAFWFIIGKFAFKPIANALKKRESDIQEALDEAKKAREEMANLRSENEALLQEAREERSKILGEAKEAKDKIIREAKEGAKEEAARILSNATLEIDNQKKKAILEVKSQAGQLALSVAGRLLRHELKNPEEQKKLIESMIGEINLS
jgi:F-type H+-transporting ATPase subunit b